MFSAAWVLAKSPKYTHKNYSLNAKVWYKKSYKSRNYLRPNSFNVKTRVDFF